MRHALEFATFGLLGEGSPILPTMRRKPASVRGSAA
jgi:hypothetical protein